MEPRMASLPQHRAAHVGLLHAGDGQHPAAPAQALCRAEVGSWGVGVDGLGGGGWGAGGRGGESGGEGARWAEARVGARNWGPGSGMLLHAGLPKPGASGALAGVPTSATCLSCAVFAVLSHA